MKCSIYVYAYALLTVFILIDYLELHVNKGCLNCKQKKGGNASF